MSDARTPALLEPAPDIDADTAVAILREHFAIEGSVAPLRSERDKNFLVLPEEGPRLILKVSNSADDPAVIDMEVAAMRHVEAVDPGLPIPRLRATVDGESVVALAAPDGRRHLVRVMTVIDGAVGDQSELPPRFDSEFGAACARLARALGGFTHPAALRSLEWDPRGVAGLRPFAADLPAGRPRESVEALLDRLEGVRERAAGLPASTFHGDVTLSNVLIDESGAVNGVIDFGDMHHTSRVSDLAISLASLLRESGDAWASAGRFLDGYQRVSPLEPEEVELLGELVLARLAATVLISAWRVPMNPGNHEYLTTLDAGSWRMIDLLGALGPAELAARFHRLCGTSRVRSAQLPDPGLLERRNARLGGVLSPLFYREPLQMVRGEGAWLFAADGRRYLDAYNNVPVVGHAHPAVVQAIARQSAALNINSRYLHPNVVELAERLTDTLPDGLDTVVFVNSGSEANDLAWRMAKVFSGNSGAVVTDCAYHGVSEATAAMSTNTYPPAHRPAHVGTFPPPAPKGDGTPLTRADAVRDVRGAREMLNGAGHDVAMLAVDTVFSSGGILEPADEYMRALAEETRAAGGLFLADEVQAGFGRGGRNLWRFMDFGVVPDFVTLGKPMGNGHPIAALITRREIAERFVQVDEYFSTFGGNPVSCAATLTVLDVVEQTGLVEHSGRIGEYLRGELHRRAGRPLTVRGQGLIAGIDIRPEETGGRTASDVAERLREAGILVGTTGPGGGTLKVRPPLVWEPGHADLFVEALVSILG